MSYRAAPPEEYAYGVRPRPVETGSWNEFLMGLRSLPPVASHGSRPRYVSELRTGAPEAVLIELGSRRGEWVTPPEFKNVYGMSIHVLRVNVQRVREKYPDVQLENRPSVGYRIVGPLPPHVERIAP